MRTQDVRAAPEVAVTGPRFSTEGPRVLELAGATAWVPDGWAGATDANGTLVLRRQA